MSFKRAWIITQKEFSIIRKNKVLIYTYVVLPLMLAIGLPLLVSHLISKGSLGAFDIVHVAGLMNAFEFFFAILGVLLCSFTAAYSIVGEKVQKSLEPLLSTPISDGEILLGKALAGFIPVMIAVPLGNAVYMALMDKFTYPLLGYPYYPNVSVAIILFLLVPLGMVFSIEVSTMSSSRVRDPRSAYQLSIVGFIPFFIVYVLTEIGIIVLTDAVLLIISGIVALVALPMYFIVTRTFDRDKILTTWK